MKIIVCIKQVPDSTKVKVDPVTGTLIRAGVPSILNPFDHRALEAALALKKEHKAEITVISMGPPQAETVVRLALALGADRGILLSDRAFAGSDTWATSYAISSAIKKAGGADLILCGVMAIDGDTAQTGPGIACQLNIPQITFCRELKVKDKTLTAKRSIDGGYETAQCPLPVLCTINTEQDYAPKYPSFVHIFAAQEKPFEIWKAADIGADAKFLGLDGSPTRVDRIYAPQKGFNAQVYNGTAGQLAAQLAEILKQESVIK